MISLKHGEIIHLYTLNEIERYGITTSPGIVDTMRHLFGHSVTVAGDSDGKFFSIGEDNMKYSWNKRWIKNKVAETLLSEELFEI